MSETDDQTLGQRDAREPMSEDGLDELSRIEVRMGEVDSELKLQQSRRKPLIYLAAVLSVIGVALLILGQSAWAQDAFPGLNLTVVGFGTALYTLVAVGSVFFLTESRLASAQSQLEVLTARKRIISRLAPSPATITEQLPPSYFDRLVSINVGNLAEYYGLVKVHTDNSFRVSISAGVIGFTLIAVGIAMGFGSNPNTQLVAYVASGSGVITEFIAGVFFYLYNRTVRQLKEYHDSLLAVQNILLAFKIVEDTRDEKEKVNMVKQMLAFLVGKQGELPSVQA